MNIKMPLFELLPSSPPRAFAVPDALPQDIMSYAPNAPAWANDLISRLENPETERQSPCLIVAAPLEGGNAATESPHAAAAVTVAMERGDKIKLAFDISPTVGATFAAIRKRFNRRREEPATFMVSLASLAMANVYNDYFGATSSKRAPNGDKLRGSGLQIAQLENPEHPELTGLALPEARWSAIFEVTKIRRNTRLSERLWGLLPASPMQRRLQKASRAVVHARLVARWDNPNDPPALLYGGKKTIETATDEGTTTLVDMRQYHGSNGTELLLPAKPAQTDNHDLVS